MKKLLLSFVVLLIIALIVVLILPSEQTVTQSVVFDSPIEAPTRLVSNPKKWTAWWPGEKINDTLFVYRQTRYHITKVLLNGFQATATNGKLQATVNFNFFVAGSTSAQFNINAVHIFSANPFIKALQYISWPGVKDSYSSFMQQVQTNFSTTEKVYGFNIERQQLSYATFISLKQPYDHIPTVAEIDSLVTELKQYVISRQGRVMDHPIMNVYPSKNNGYEAMVAMATDKPLPSTNRYFLKNMVLGGYVMVAEVKGGEQLINSCKQEMENYVQDHRKSSPAIPFQQMITNRVQVKDSTQWITKLYYPVRE